LEATNEKICNPTLTPTGESAHVHTHLMLYQVGTCHLCIQRGWQFTTHSSILNCTTRQLQKLCRRFSVS